MKLPIPNDWDGISWCRYSICWPDSELWRGILRGFITLPARGRTWDERSGSILDIQQVGVEIREINIPLQEVIMACGDTGLQEIAQALNSIAISLQQQVIVQANCCTSGGGGSAGTGSIAPPYSPVDGSGDPETDPPPTGFPDWPTFDANKCAIAQDIVNTLIGDLGRLSTITFTGIILAELLPIVIGLLLTPIPGDEIAGICFLLLTAATLANQILDQMQDLLINNKQDLVCALYNGQTAAQSEQFFLVKFGELYDGLGVGEPSGTIAKGTMNNMIGPDVVNRLFTLETNRTLPPGDCSECEPQVICFTFNTDLEDWHFYDGWQDGTVTWDSGAMIMTPTEIGGGGETGLYAESPEINHTVVLGENYGALYDVNGTTVNVGVYIVIDDVEILINASNSPVSEDNCLGGFLDEYEGQVIQRFRVRAVRSEPPTAWTVEIKEVGINCPTCTS